MPHAHPLKEPSHKNAGPFLPRLQGGEVLMQGAKERARPPTAPPAPPIRLYMQCTKGRAPYLVLANIHWAFIH